MSVDAALLEDVARVRAPGIFRTAVRIAGRNWTAGSVTFVTPSGEAVRLTGKEPGPDARLIISNYSCLRRALVSGDIGFAEGYMAGEWDTPDLAALLGAFSLNFDNIKQLGEGALLARLVNGLHHALHGNSRRGSKQHPRPLRPGQRLLVALAGRDDDLLLGALRDAGAGPRRRPAQ
jgi:hypothetical protein